MKLDFNLFLGKVNFISLHVLNAPFISEEN